MRAGARVAHAAFLFVSAAWFGGLLFFAAAGARIVLRSAPTRHAGGTINRELLDALDVASWGAAALLLVLWGLSRGAIDATPARKGFVVRLLLLAAAAAFASSFVITPEMIAVRDRMGTILDLVPKTDPLRKEWSRLHALSSLSLLIRLLAVSGAFTLVASFGRLPASAANADAAPVRRGSPETESAPGLGAADDVESKGVR